MICSAFRNAQSLAFVQFQLPKKYPTIAVLFVDLIFIFTGFYIVSIILLLSIFKLSFCFRPVIIHFTGVRQSIKNVETSSKTVESSEKRNISNNNQSSNKVKDDRYPQTKNWDDQKKFKAQFLPTTIKLSMKIILGSIYTFFGIFPLYYCGIRFSVFLNNFVLVILNKIDHFVRMKVTFCH